MLRKSLLLCIVPLVYTICVITSGCLRHKVKVCSIHLAVGDGDGTHYNWNKDTVTSFGKFRFYLTTDEVCYVQAPNPFLAPCYATSVCQVWQNDLDTTTFGLIFDKPVIIGNDTLLPQADALKNPAFKKYLPISLIEKGCKDLTYEIGTDNSTMLQHMTLDTGVYKATFTCTTTDGKALLAERYIRFEQ